MEKCRSEGTQAGGTLSQLQMQTLHKNQVNKNRDHHILTSTRSMDYDMDLVSEKPENSGLDGEQVATNRFILGQRLTPPQ